MSTSILSPSRSRFSTLSHGTAASATALNRYNDLSLEPRIIHNPLLDSFLASCLLKRCTYNYQCANWKHDRSLASNRGLTPLVEERSKNAIILSLHTPRETCILDRAARTSTKAYNSANFLSLRVTIVVFLLVDFFCSSRTIRHRCARR